MHGKLNEETGPVASQTTTQPILWPNGKITCSPKRQSLESGKIDILNNCKESRFV